MKESGGENGHQEEIMQATIDNLNVLEVLTGREERDRARLDLLLRIRDSIKQRSKSHTEQPNEVIPIYKDYRELIEILEEVRGELERVSKAKTKFSEKLTTQEQTEDDVLWALNNRVEVLEAMVESCEFIIQSLGEEIDTRVMPRRDDEWAREIHEQIDRIEQKEETPEIYRNITDLTSNYVSEELKTYVSQIIDKAKGELAEVRDHLSQRQGSGEMSKTERQSKNDDQSTLIWMVGGIKQQEEFFKRAEAKLKGSDSEEAQRRIKDLRDNIIFLETYDKYAGDMLDAIVME